MNHKAPPTARRAGLARHLALDHNPLRRRADRLETCIMAGLLAAFLAGAPVVAGAAGRRAPARNPRPHRAQRPGPPVPPGLPHPAPPPPGVRPTAPPTRWGRARGAP